MSKKITLIFLFIVLNKTLMLSQNLFPEKYVGCSTESFSLEMDTVRAKINVQDFIKTIFQNVSEKTKNKIEGELFLQILVDLEGKSCLISLENKTNIKTKRLNLKETIDNKIMWSKPKEMVSPVIILRMKSKQVFFSRWGMNGNTGWHEINKT